jgi:hypothetical protein
MSKDVRPWFLRAACVTVRPSEQWGDERSAASAAASKAVSSRHWHGPPQQRRLVAARRIAVPRGNVGSRLEFADGGAGVVYLEMVRHGMPTTDPATLVMAFRLRFIGRQPLLHKLFQLDSTMNAPTFAGSPGFRTKPWAYDPDNTTYRGIYEWDDAAQAERYAATVSKLIGIVSVPGSVRYHIAPGVHLDTFLRDPTSTGEVDPSASNAWWWLQQPAELPRQSVSRK